MQIWPVDDWGVERGGGGGGRGGGGETDWVTSPDGQMDPHACKAVSIFSLDFKRDFEREKA